MGMISRTPKASESPTTRGKKLPPQRITHKPYGGPDGKGQQRKIDDVLVAEGDGPAGKPLLQLAGRHQAAGKRQKPENHLGHQRAGAEAGDVIGVGP